MTVIRSVNALGELRDQYRAAGEKIALVPTMGALHQGHISLVEAAKNSGARVIVTIFVNPKQFNNQGDLSAYPRTEADDLTRLAPLSPDAVYIPDMGQIYPEGFATNIQISGVTDSLEGAHRPGHFDGVATVVAKLFNQSGATHAYFGEKDFQQLQLIRRLVRDLDMGVEVIGCPTLRETDGLAMSSRNTRLSVRERAIAPVLKHALDRAARALRAGDETSSTLANAEQEIVAAGFASVEYVALHSEVDFLPIETLDQPARLLVAAQLGDVRLIDNIAV